MGWYYTTILTRRQTSNYCHDEVNMSALIDRFARSRKVHHIDTPFPTPLDIVRTHFLLGREVSFESFCLSGL
jgi:hypothetical protein